MNKPLAVIKAAAAGVTALYLARQSADLTLDGHTVANVDSAALSRSAAHTFALAIQDLTTSEEEVPF